MLLLLQGVEEKTNPRTPMMKGEADLTKTLGFQEIGEEGEEEIETASYQIPVKLRFTHHQNLGSIPSFDWT
jgi:hypothetical protein